MNTLAHHLANILPLGFHSSLWLVKIRLWYHLRTPLMNYVERPFMKPQLYDVALHLTENGVSGDASLVKFPIICDSPHSRWAVCILNQMVLYEYVWYVRVTSIQVIERTVKVSWNLMPSSNKPYFVAWRYGFAIHEHFHKQHKTWFSFSNHVNGAG